MKESTVTSLRKLFHPEKVKQLEEQMKSHNEFTARWVLSDVNLFNENGGDFKITNMSVNNDVVNLSVENSKGHKTGLSLIKSNWMQ